MFLDPEFKRLCDYWRRKDIERIKFNSKRLLEIYLEGPKSINYTVEESINILTEELLNIE